MKKLRKRRFSPLLIRTVIILLILCQLPALTACEPRPPSAGAGAAASGSDASLSREEPVQSHSEDEGTDRSSLSESSGSSGYTMGPYDEMLLVYGGVLERPRNGKPYLRASEVGFYYLDDWEDPEEIESGSYYSWFLSMVLKEDISDPEKRKKYKSPLEGDTGWFFPQDLYESEIQKYFEVSTEHLRKERYIYDPELEGYYLESGGGVSVQPEIILLGASEDGGTVKLNIQLGSDGSGTAARKLLTVKKLPDGGFKFLSYIQTP